MKGKVVSVKAHTRSFPSKGKVSRVRKHKRRVVVSTPRSRGMATRTYEGPTADVRRELVENYHTSKAALPYNATKLERQTWAVDGYVKEHPQWKGREIVLLLELQEDLQDKPV